MSAAESIFPSSGSRYELEELIAVGGMARVYRGLQRGAAGFARPVAIKRTHRHVLAMPNARQMILREAAYASAVRHPNVVSVDDVEEFGDELFLVMDLVDGLSLAQLLKRRAFLPVSVVVAIAIDICRGVHAIHTALDGEGRPLGLVHRDVSPQNVMVGRDGIAKITDFGIARRLGDPKQTSRSLRRGKCGYMAPEYILSGEATPSCDVFALGVVVWEALARRVLFEGETDIEIVRNNLEGAVNDLHRENPEVSPGLAAVVRRALVQDLRERWSSAAEFADALAAAAPSIATRAEVAAAVEADAGASGEDAYAPTKPVSELPSQVRISCRPTRLVPSDEAMPALGSEIVLAGATSHRFPAFRLEEHVPPSRRLDARRWALALAVCALFALVLSALR